MMKKNLFSIVCFLLVISCDNNGGKVNRIMENKELNLHSQFSNKNLNINIPNCYYESSTGQKNNVTTISFLFPAGYFNPRSEDLFFDCLSLDVSKASNLRFTVSKNQKDNLLIKKSPNDYLKQLEMLNTNTQNKLIGEVENYQVFKSGVKNITVLFKKVPQKTHPISISFIPAAPHNTESAFPAIVKIKTIIADEFIVTYSLRADRMSIYKSESIGVVDELMNIYLNNETILMHPDLIQKIVINNEKVTNLIERNIEVGT